VYTHWQASWRSGIGLGVIVVGAILMLSGPFTAETILQRALLMLATILGGALYTLAVIVSFRFGLRFSGRPRVGRSVVVITPVLYLAALAAISFVRIQTPAQLAEVLTARDALIYNVVIPSGLFLLKFVLLPALIAFATARIVEHGRVPPNTSFERMRER
jgi:hypothetical protein